MDLLLAARLSQERGGSQTGIETQDQDARAWAERNGHRIIAVAADKKSGTRAMHERPPGSSTSTTTLSQYGA